MIRKLVSYLLCTCILFTVASCALAETTHTWVLDHVSSDWELEGPALGGHRFSIFRYEICADCGMTRRIAINSKVEHCTNSYYRDGGHSANSTTHCDIYRCVICLQETYSYRYCSGPPCVLPQNIEVEQ